MKIYFLIFTFSLIGLILNNEYDLTSEKSQTFAALYYGTTYKFYIKCEYGEKVLVNITSTTNFTKNQEIYFYEYSDRTSRYSLNSKTTYPESNNCTEYIKKYEPSNNKTQYVAFEITPKISMSLVEISAKVSNTAIKVISNFLLTLFIIIISIPILICIIIFIIIFCVCRPSKKTNGIVYNNNDPNQYPNQALYPSNNTQYYPSSQNFQNNTNPQYNPPPMM